MCIDAYRSKDFYRVLYYIYDIHSLFFIWEVDTVMNMIVLCVCDLYGLLVVDTFS